MPCRGEKGTPAGVKRVPVPRSAQKNLLTSLLRSAIIFDIGRKPMEVRKHMKKYKVMLKTIDDIKVFAAAASCCKDDLDLSSGRYVVDAKSIMGIFSLDLSKPITLSAPESFNDEEFLSKIQKLIVTE